MSITSRWSDAQTLEFVKIYRKHPCLWDHENPGFKLRHARDQACQDMAEEFHAATEILLTIDDVKRKIRSLKTTYVSEATKLLQRSESMGSEFKSNLTWFYEMESFMKSQNHYRPRRTPNKWDSQTEPEDSSEQVWLPLEAEYIEDELSGTDTKPKLLQRKILKRKKKPVLPDSNFEQARSSAMFSPAMMMQQMHEDEFDIYGKYVASQLRQIELQKALRLQLEIQNMLSKARVDDASI